MLALPLSPPALWSAKALIVPLRNGGLGLAVQVMQLMGMMSTPLLKSVAALWVNVHLPCGFPVTFTETWIVVLAGMLEMKSGSVSANEREVGITARLTPTAARAAVP